jgi:hypothetical protein
MEIFHASKTLLRNLRTHVTFFFYKVQLLVDWVIFSHFSAKIFASTDYLSCFWEPLPFSLCRLLLCRGGAGYATERSQKE